jgi:hypothetical protein
MAVKLTNSNDIFANSVSLFENNDIVNIKDLFVLKGESLTTSTVYTKQEIDQQLATKQATLSSSTALSVASLTAQTLVTTPAIRAPTTLNIYTNALSSPTMSLSSSLIETMYLLIASGGFRVVNGLSSGKKDSGYNYVQTLSIDQNGNLTSSGTIKSNKLTSRYIETPSDNLANDIQLKADSVQFIGLDNVCYWNASKNECKFYTNFYLDYVMTCRDGIVIGTEGGYSVPPSSAYYEYMRIDNQGNITTTGYIVATGSITGGSLQTLNGNISSFSGNIETVQGAVVGKAGSFQSLAITGTSLRPEAPTTQGCYIGQATNGYTAIEICSDPLYQSRIDFTVPNSNYKGRLLYDFPTNEFRFNVNSSSTSRMVLTDTSLTVAGDVKANNFIANSGSLNLKGDLIQLKGTNLMPMIEVTPTQTIMYNEVLFDGSIKTDGFIYVGSYASGTTGWTDKCVIGPAGDIAALGTITGGTLTSLGNISTTNGTISGRSLTSSTTITATGDITGNVGSFSWLKCTGSSGRPAIPTTYGAYLGAESASFSGLELVCDSVGYIDITTPNNDSKGRYAFNIPSQYWYWAIGSTERMRLTATTLTVNGSAVSSDKRLKFNEKPLVNALNVINRLEPVEYDQTQDLVDEYTSDTPQSHQCGFIAQSVAQIDELKHAVIGGEVDDEGKESIRALNYNAVFTYAVKAIQELSDIVKQQQQQINKLLGL